jgi:hypothetical protein
MVEPGMTHGNGLSRLADFPALISLTIFEGIRVPFALISAASCQEDEGRQARNRRGD